MTPGEIENLLHSLGFDRVVRRGMNIMACCPNHDERNPSWGVRAEPPYLHGCFGCGYKGTIAFLLHDRFGWSYSKISRVTGIDLKNNKAVSDFNFGVVNQHRVKTPEVDEQQLWPFEMEPKGKRYLLSRGITWDTIKKAGLLYHRQDDRILFPWWWENKFYGMTGRACFDTDDKIRGYCGIKKSRLLYAPGKNLTPRKPVILVEGEIDALKVFQAGYSNVAALGYGGFSKGKLELLQSLPVKSVVIFYDWDDAGRRLTEETFEKLEGVCAVSEVDWTLVVKDSKKSDPGKLTDGQIVKLLRNRRRKIVWPSF